MKLRQIIENDIVEDIALYKDIRKEFINYIREEIKEDYEPKYSFDEFCVRMINNFEGIDDEFDINIGNTGKPLTARLFQAVLKVAMDEFKDDEEALIILKESILNDKNNETDIFSAS